MRGGHIIMTYAVDVKEIDVTTIYVDAKTPGEAEKIAMEMWCDGAVNMSDCDCEVYFENIELV